MKFISSTKTYILGIFPGLFYLIIFYIIPLFLLVVSSTLVRDHTGGFKHGFTVNAWQNLFSSSIAKVFFNSIIDATLVTVLCGTLAYFTATYLLSLDSRKKFLLLILFLLPAMVDILIKTFAWMNLIGQGGVFESILPITARMNLSAISHSRYTLILIFLITYFPFMLLPLYISLENINRHHIIASHDLGANKIKTFKNIIFPLSILGFAGGGILVFLPVLSNFLFPEIIAGGKYAMIGTLIKFRFFDGRDWPSAASISIIILFISLLLLLLIRIMNSKFRHGMLKQ